MVLFCVSVFYDKGSCNNIFFLHVLSCAANMCVTLCLILPFNV